MNTDVVFVLDSSGSVGPENFETAKNYVYNFTEGLLNGDPSSRVGVIRYASGASVEMELRQREKQVLLQEIRNLLYVGGSTNTPEGLCLLKERPWRPSLSVLRIAIVVTDGESNQASPTCLQESGVPGTVDSVAEEIHSLHPPITVLAIGVADYDPAELRTIATDVRLVDYLETFDYRILQQNQQSRSYFICFRGMP